MFREMRRPKQKLSTAECEATLYRATGGVLAVQGDEGYPYAVPMSYVYAHGHIYFHCAKAGHKIDALLHSPKVSFCVIDQDEIVPQEYTTYYRSVIAFGKAVILEDESQKRHALKALLARYSPHEEENWEREIERDFPQVCVVQMQVEHLAGKVALELVKNSQC